MGRGPPSKLKTDRHDDFYNFRLRQARIDAGYTREDLADMTGISMKSIYRYERLSRSPSRATARKIADALGKSVDYLFPECLRRIAREMREEREHEEDSPDLVYLPSGLRAMDNKHEVDYNERLCRRLDQVLAKLEPRQEAVIKMYFGYDREPITLIEVSNIFGVTRARIWEIKEKALKMLRHPSRRKELEDFL